MLLVHSDLKLIYPLFWTDCVLHAGHLINRIPSSILHCKTTYELNNFVPTYSQLRVFSCLTYTFTFSSNRSKLPQALRNVFTLASHQELRDTNCMSCFPTLDLFLKMSFFTKRTSPSRMNPFYPSPLAPNTAETPFSFQMIYSLIRQLIFCKDRQ